jgi:hypothetical protein
MLQAEKNIRSFLQRMAPVTPESGISTPGEGFHSPDSMEVNVTGEVNRLFMDFNLFMSGLRSLKVRTSRNRSRDFVKSMFRP